MIVGRTLNDFRLGSQLQTALDQCLLEGIQRGESLMRHRFAPQRPSMFRRLSLGRRRRQIQQLDAGWHN